MTGVVTAEAAVDETRTALPSPSRHLPALALGAVIAAGVALRVWLLRSPMGLFDSDEALSPLIARHMLRGEFSVFLWGTPYGGTLEAVIGAPILALWDDPRVLKLVTVTLYALGCVLTWAIGRRLLRDESVARFAAALMWVGSAGFVFGSIKARLYYSSGLCLALGIVLCCVALGEARSRRWTALLGLLLGLGLWTTPMVGYVAIPALAWLLATRRDRWFDLPFAVPGALLGSAPWIAFNIKNRGASFNQNSSFGANYLDRLGGFFEGLLPRSLGLRALGSEGWMGPDALAVALYVGFLALFLAGVVWAWRRRDPSIGFLLWLACAYPFLFAAPNASFYVTEPRYGLFLWPVLALLLAAAVTRLLRSPVLQVGVLGLAVAGSAAGLVATMNWNKANPWNWDWVPPDTRPLAAALTERGTTTVWTEYWISYSLVLSSRERVIADPPEYSRYKPYARQVRNAGTTTHVYFAGSTQEREFLAEAQAAGIPVRATRLDQFQIFDAARPLPSFSQSHRLAEQAARLP